MAKRFGTTTVTIANGASLSGAADLSGVIGGGLVAIIPDAAFDTNVLTFQASADNSTFSNLYNSSGAEVTTGSIAASNWYALDPADFAGIPYLKVRSGTSGAAVNQVGATVLTLVFRAV